MGCFKQAWSSFWRKNQGIGMIETALLLPIFLMFAFAVMDFGNYLIVKNRIVSANQAIASAIQNNPTMTTGAWGSSTDLEKVIQNSLGNLWFNASGGYIGYTGVSIWTSKTVPTVTSAPGWGSHAVWEQRNIKSPWLSDSDPSNDNNAYYVGVFVWRGVPFLTPLPKLLGFDGSTPGFGDSEESRGNGAPHGRKVADSFTVVTHRPSFGDVTCSNGQAIVGFSNGKFICGNAGNNYSFSCRVQTSIGTAGGAVSPACGPGEVLVGGGGDCGWTTSGVADGLVNMSRPSNHWNSWLFDCDLNPSSGGVGAGNYAYGICCSLIKK
jgi:hypothetical protein